MKGKICPLLMIANMQYEGDQLCVGERCGWFDQSAGQCAIWTFVLTMVKLVHQQ
jgi:hypothetical protein